MQKEYILLDLIIEEFMKNSEPVGSETIRVNYDMKVSSATIRNYSRKLVKLGELHQEHSCGGRIPTQKALKNYWDKEPLLQHTAYLDKSSSADIASYYNLFFVYKSNINNSLQEVINVKNRFLLLVFDDFEISAKYTNKLEIFLKEFLGAGVLDVCYMLNQVGLKSIAKKIESALDEHSNLFRSDLNILADMTHLGNFGKDDFDNIFYGTILNAVNNGIFFDNFIPNGYMAVVQDADLEQQEGRMLLVGKINSNLKNFYKNTKI